MIQKFSKNGKLKLSVAIDPINPVSTMVPNKSSTKNTATESNKPNSGSLVSIDHELLAQEASKWQSFHNRWIRTCDGGLKKGSMTSLTSNIEMEIIYKMLNHWLSIYLLL